MLTSLAVPTLFANLDYQPPTSPRCIMSGGGANLRQGGVIHYKSGRSSGYTEAQVFVRTWKSRQRISIRKAIKTIFTINSVAEVDIPGVECGTAAA
jgi:hypothetical protein